MAYYYSPFRTNYKNEEPGDACVFCTDAILERAIGTDEMTVENASYRWIVNAYPKFEGHTLLVPKRHVTELGTETPEEAADREELLRYASEVLTRVFPGSGIEVFLQTGTGSGASISHLHWHVVPAFPDDPFRSFEKLGHFYTIEPGKERVVIFPIPIERTPDELREELSRALSTSERR